MGLFKWSIDWNKLYNIWLEKFSIKFISPCINVDIEYWKWNKKYRLYVSTKGKVLDIHKKEVKQTVNNSGYLCVEYGEKSNITVHRLVMKTFKPIENEDIMTVDHLSSNKRNNELSKLEWVEKKENQAGAIENKTKEIIATKKEKEGRKVVYKEKHVFNSMKDAVLWVKGREPSLKNKKDKYIESMIKLSLNDEDDKYLGFNWYYKGE